jgi:hypothetical protein
MEKAERKPRINVWLLVIALLLIIAIAACIYYIMDSGRNREPNRGTYVMAVHDGVKGL